MKKKNRAKYRKIKCMASVIEFKSYYARCLHNRLSVFSNIKCIFSSNIAILYILCMNHTSLHVHVEYIGERIRDCIKKVTFSTFNAALLFLYFIALCHTSIVPLYAKLWIFNDIL